MLKYFQTSFASGEKTPLTPHLWISAPKTFLRHLRSLLHHRLRSLTSRRRQSWSTNQTKAPVPVSGLRRRRKRGESLNFIFSNIFKIIIGFAAISIIFEMVNLQTVKIFLNLKISDRSGPTAAPVPAPCPRPHCGDPLRPGTGSGRRWSLRRLAGGSGHQPSPARRRTRSTRTTTTPAGS